jgi:DNA-binding NtrC family response regulator
MSTDSNANHLLLISTNPGLRANIEKCAALIGALVEMVASADAAFSKMGKGFYRWVLLEDTSENSRHWPSLPTADITLIVVSANITVDTAIQWMRTGASDLLPLSAPVETLLGALSCKRKPAKNTSASEPDQAWLGAHPAIETLRQQVIRIAPLPTPILITGETGSGKSLLARQIHAQSGRKGAFVAINCAAFSTELIESELFGHQKGAFTGALQNRDGLFFAAEQGTLFLDEIAELPLTLQAKLLHVLDDNTIRPVGSDQTRKINVRIVAATHQPLLQWVHARKFRADLFYRLSIIPLHIPPLRERASDIPQLTTALLRQISSQLAMSAPALPDSALQDLMSHPWPGNVRELRNYIEKSLALGIPLGEQLPALHAAEADSRDKHWKRLDELEKQHIMAALDRSYDNKSQAALLLGISRRTLERKLKMWEDEDAA